MILRYRVAERSHYESVITDMESMPDVRRLQRRGRSGRSDTECYQIFKAVVTIRDLVTPHRSIGLFIRKESLENDEIWQNKLI